MTSHDTRGFEDLVAEGVSVPTEGWDFSWFDGRATEQRPTWGYAVSLAALPARAGAALDIQTGGGEVLDFALGRAVKAPVLSAATEGWPPNIAMPHGSSQNGNSREQSRAGGTARWRGCAVPVRVKVAFAGRVTRAGDGGGRRAGGPEVGHGPPDLAGIHPFALGISCDPAVNPLREAPLRRRQRVAMRFRRVIVARRCAQHHLRRVMVETPPRAGPSPPHGPARFFCPHAVAVRSREGTASSGRG